MKVPSSASALQRESHLGSLALLLDDDFADLVRNERDKGFAFDPGDVEPELVGEEFGLASRDEFVGRVDVLGSQLLRTGGGRASRLVRGGVSVDESLHLLGVVGELHAVLTLNTVDVGRFLLNDDLVFTFTFGEHFHASRRDEEVNDERAERAERLVEEDVVVGELDSANLTAGEFGQLSESAGDFNFDVETKDAFLYFLHNFFLC